MKNPENQQLTQFWIDVANAHAQVLTTPERVIRVARGGLAADIMSDNLDNSVLIQVTPAETATIDTLPVP
jgi:hypothetical protein